MICKSRKHIIIQISLNRLTWLQIPRRYCSRRLWRMRNAMPMSNHFTKKERKSEWRYEEIFCWMNCQQRNPSRNFTGSKGAVKFSASLESNITRDVKKTAATTGCMKNGTSRLWNSDCVYMIWIRKQTTYAVVDTKIYKDIDIYVYIFTYEYVHNSYIDTYTSIYI